MRGADGAAGHLPRAEIRLSGLLRFFSRAAFRFVLGLCFLRMIVRIAVNPLILNRRDRHLGIKLVELYENIGRGRPRIDIDALLRYECLWVHDFSSLRDGAINFEAELPQAGSFIKSVGSDRNFVHVVTPGHTPRVIQQTKFLTSPKEDQQEWKEQTEREEARFDREMKQPVKAAICFAPERNLWESLKRATKASEVRRICSRSERWLKPRWEFPSGGYIEYWPWRRILYKRAEQFVIAKLDARYPARDQRESGDYRRIEYFARVMAGLTLRASPSTAVDKLRKLKHADECRCWRCRFEIAPRFAKTLEQYLTEMRPTAQMLNDLSV